PSVPGQVEGRREDADPVAGPRRQDLSSRHPRRSQSHRRAGRARPGRHRSNPLATHSQAPRITMLDDSLKGQLQAYLQRVNQPFELVASLDEQPSSRELEELLKTIAGLSDK